MKKSIIPHFWLRVMWSAAPSRLWWTSSISKNKPPRFRGWDRLWNSRKILHHSCNVTCCSSPQGVDFLSPTPWSWADLVTCLDEETERAEKWPWGSAQQRPPEASWLLLNYLAASSPTLWSRWPWGETVCSERPGWQPACTCRQAGPPWTVQGRLGHHMTVLPGWPGPNSQKRPLSPVPKLPTHRTVSA